MEGHPNDLNPPDDRAPSDRRTAVARGWLALGTLTLLLGLGAMFPVAPIRPADGLPLPEVHLVRPLGYVLTAPLSQVLDLVSLWDRAQHPAVLATLLGIAAATWRPRRPGLGRAGPGRLRAIRRLALGAISVVASILMVYAAAAYLPRPAATLAVSDPDLVRVDFHSHTAASHDAASWISAEDNRRWHARTGYDVAFVSDHQGWGAIPEALAGNPRRVGDGTVLLSALEVWYQGDHAIALGDSLRYRWAFDPDRKRIERDSLMNRPSELALLLTIPGKLEKIERLMHPGTPTEVIGVEIVDGSPAGLRQSRTARDTLLDLTSKHDLARVASSNYHGAGQTAVSWSLLRLPGWRDATPTELAAEIEALVRSGGAEDVRVVERSIPGANEALNVVLTVPASLWHLARSMSAGERVMWIVWAALVWLWVRPRERSDHASTSGRIPEAGIG